MPGFEPVFGGTTIAPANATFLNLALTADTTLAWPIEQSINDLVVADTIEVQASAPGLSITLPDARQVSTGYTTLFNNTGANTFSVKSSTGSVIVSPVSGTAWVIYLADNSTAGGTWRTFQLGASVSVAVAAALAGAGLKAISTALAQDIPITSVNATPVTLVDANRAQYVNWTGGLGVLNLPAAGTVGNGWYVQIRNSGSGDLTVTPAAGTIDGAATKTFAAGTSAFVVTDGVNWLTLGFGSGTGGGGGSGFDFVEIDVSGSGTYVLSGVNLNRIAYRFKGVLTGNRTIQVPSAIQEYWIANITTGAFSLFVKTLPQAAPGIEVLQNNQAILYCDGNNVIAANSSSVSFPIPVAQGGTGAVNPASARTNLGATATGSSLFTAVDANAARAVIGSPPSTRAINTGTGLTGGGDLSADRTIALAAAYQVDTENGTYVTGSWTGGIGTATVTYRRVGRIVSLQFKVLGILSGGPFTLLSETGGAMPASLRPARELIIPVTIRQGGVGPNMGHLSIATSGNMVVQTNSSNFSSGTTNGIGGPAPNDDPVNVTYLLD